jgi:hypothetical protein
MKSKPNRLSTTRKKLKGRFAPIGVFVSLVILGAALLATVALPRNSSQASPKKYKATKEIVLDKTTGTVRKPTPEETDVLVAQISSLTNRSTEGLTTTTSPNGTAMMDLDGRFGGVVLGRATADGGTEVRCVFTLEEATDFLGLEEGE